MNVVYLAHPVAGDVEANLARARRWFRWATENYPSMALVAPWIVGCELWDDADPIQRSRGMARNFAVIDVCDDVLLVGGRVSPGMLEEARFAEAVGVRVWDLTHLGDEPVESYRAPLRRWVSA